MDIFLYNCNAINTPNNNSEASVSYPKPHPNYISQLSLSDFSELESKQAIHITLGFYDSCISYLIINFFVRVKKQTQSEIQRRTCEDSMPAVIFGGRGNMHGGKNEWKKTRRK